MKRYLPGQYQRAKRFFPEKKKNFIRFRQVVIHYTTMRRASSNNSANILDQIYSNNGTKKKTPRTARSLIPQRRKKPTPKSPRSLKTLKNPQPSKTPKTPKTPETPEISDPVKVQTSPVVNGSSGVSKAIPSSHAKSPMRVFSVDASITEKEKNETDRMNDEHEKSVDPGSEKSSESEDGRDDDDMDEDISIENFFNEEPSSSDVDTELPEEEHVQTITISGSDEESGESGEIRGSGDGENSEENDEIETMDVETPESNLRILSIKRGKQNISYCQALLDHYSKLAKNNNDESLLLMPAKVIKVMETLLCNDGVLSTISGIVETSERSVEKARRDFETNGKRNATDYIGKIPCSRHVQQLNWRVKSFYKYAKSIFSDNGIEKIPILFATSSVVNARINSLMRDRDADSIKSLSESLEMDKNDLTSQLKTMNDRFCTAFDEGHELAKRFGIYKETRGRKRKQAASKQDKAKSSGIDSDQSDAVDVDLHDGTNGLKNGKNGKSGKTKRSKTNPVVVQIEAAPQTFGERNILETHVNISAGSELVRSTFEEANHGEAPSLGELTKNIYFTPYVHEHVLDLYHKHQNRARTYAEELSLIAPHDPDEDWELHTLFMKNKKSLIEANPFTAAFRFPYMKDAFRDVSKGDAYTFSLKNPFYAEMSIRFSEEGGLIFHCEQLRCDFHIPKEIVFIIQSLPVFKEMRFGQKFFSWFVIADESNSELNGHLIPLGANFN